MGVFWNIYARAINGTPWIKPNTVDCQRHKTMYSYFDDTLKIDNLGNECIEKTYQHYFNI
jgi:hypothetical protein